MRLTYAELEPWVRAYRSRPGNGAGGSLHVVLEDLNIKDAHVQECRAWAYWRGDYAGAVLACLLMHASQRTRLRLAHEAMRAAL